MKALQTCVLMISLVVRAAGADAAVLPIAIMPGDAHVGYSGRWDAHESDGPRCAWPACSIRLHLRGTALNVLLSGGRELAFQVLVDGVPTTTITLADGQGIYAAATQLTPGEHTVEVMRRNEAFQGIAQFKGFQVAAGTTVLPIDKPTRRIEFIGDSITCGYGDEAPSQNEHFSPRTANAALAWGAVAARLLKADLMVEAWSGIWLMDNGHDQPMPKRWGRTLPSDDSSQWTFSAWTPDAVVINLGTNDGNKPIEEAAWDEAYRAFIVAIRSHYPKAHIFLSIGSMGHGPHDCLIGYNDRLAAAYAAQGDMRIHALALPNQKQEDGIGADWHPSVKTHRIMAILLVAAVKQALAWP
jgi:lysophospholipase L1-like esterase